MNQSTIHYAYDLSKSVRTKGEIHDSEAIAQSIEMIILTMFKERLFNHGMGSIVGAILFNRINESSGEQLLDSIIEAINRIEDRVIILSEQCGLQIYSSESYMILTIVYIIKFNGLVTKFEKKLIY